ncbi:hypothetical protein D9758_005383 [Tetrapyrgos nigripes]|uniref:GATOR2 complex protein MIO zinc-ribbon like domain-containing protein n=1 Tax=Tetrapyrgos nigripes TaxID=182062 RepID=A0A8H5LQ49_9AGAR|nr:hypothetical protein D9758_005383 [Tetrapyrgos nigripes]
MKQVLWSPLSSSTFLVGGGSQLTLYNYSHEKIRLVTSIDDLNVRQGSSLQCFAWCPSKAINDLVAVGHSTGRVDLLRLGPSRYAEPAAVVPLNIKNQRPCNALSWRDSAYLAVGLEKVRGDASLLVWDISASLPIFSNSNTSTFSSLSPVNNARIVQHHAQTELVSALAWSSGPANLLLASISNRWLRLFDIRAATTSVANVASKVHGFAIDPIDENRFACWGDGVVNVWDMRKLTANSTGGAAAGSSSSGTPVLSFTEHDAAGDGGLPALYNPYNATSSLSASPATPLSPVTALASSRAASRIRTQSAGSSHSSSPTAAATTQALYRHAVFSTARRGTIATLTKDAVCVRVWDILEAKAYNLYSSSLPKSSHDQTPEQSFASQQAASTPPLSKRSWASLAAYMPGGSEDKEKDTLAQPHIQIQRRPSSTRSINGRDWETDYLVLADTRRTTPVYFPTSSNTTTGNTPSPAVSPSTPSPAALSSFALVPPFSTHSHEFSSDNLDDDEYSESDDEHSDSESPQRELAAKIETKVLLLTTSGSLAIRKVWDAPKYRGSWSVRGDIILDYGPEISPLATESLQHDEPKNTETSGKGHSRSRPQFKAKSQSRSMSRTRSGSRKRRRQETRKKSGNDRGMITKENYGQVFHTLQMDVSMVMKARAEKGYGLTEPPLNVSILRDVGPWISDESSSEIDPGKECAKLGLGLDDLLADTWEWVANANRLLSTPTSLIHGWDFAYAGLWYLWRGPQGIPRYYLVPTRELLDLQGHGRSHSHIGTEKENTRDSQKILQRRPAPLGQQSSLSSIISGGSDDSAGTLATVASAASGSTGGLSGPGFPGFGKPAPSSPPLSRGHDSPSRSDSLSSMSSMNSMGLGRFDGEFGTSSSPATSSIHSLAGSFTGSGPGSISGSVASLAGSSGSGSGGSASGSYHGSLGSGLRGANFGYDDDGLDEIRVLEEEATPVHRDRLELPLATDLRGGSEHGESLREHTSPGLLRARNPRQNTRHTTGHRTRRSWSPSAAATGLGLLGSVSTSSGAPNTGSGSTSHASSAIPSDEQEWLTALEILAARADAGSSITHDVVGGISAAAGKSKSSNRTSWNAGGSWKPWSPWIPVATTKLLQRKVCLELLGWGFVMHEREGDWDVVEAGKSDSDHDIGLKEVIRRWEAYDLMDKDRSYAGEGTATEVKWNGHARAACWLVLMGKHEAAAECLMRSRDEAHHMMSGTMIALTPYCAVPLASASTATSTMHNASTNAPNLTTMLDTPNLTPTPTRTQLPTVHTHPFSNFATSNSAATRPRLSPALKDHYSKLTDKMQDPYLRLLLMHMTQLAFGSDSSAQPSQVGDSTSTYAFPGPMASATSTSGATSSKESSPVPTQTPLLHALESPEMQTYLPFRERLAMAFAFLDDQGVTEYLRKIWVVCRPDSDGYTHGNAYRYGYASGPGTDGTRSRSRASSKVSQESGIGVSLTRRRSWDGVRGADVNVPAGRKGSLSRTSTRESIKSRASIASESGSEGQGAKDTRKPKKRAETESILHDSPQMMKADETTQLQHVGGDVDALIVVGAGTPEGREVLGRWVDRVGDVQSAAMLGWLGACVGVGAPPIPGSDNGKSRGRSHWKDNNRFDLPKKPKTQGYQVDPRVERWVEAYRELLDGLKMFHSRVEFDIARGEVLRGALLRSSIALGAPPYPLEEPLVPRQILIRCNYCNKSILPPTPTTVASSTNQGPVSHLGLNLGPGQTHGHGGQGDGTVTQKGKPTVCPNCRKSLPRCSVCLMTLGIVPDAVREAELVDASTGGRVKDTMDEAIIMCQTCRHGGHASHILEWFFGTDEEISELGDLQEGFSVGAVLGLGYGKPIKTCPVADCNCRCADEM